jgi:hypothetical protein
MRRGRSAILVALPVVLAACGGASTATVTPSSGGEVHAVSEGDSGSTVRARVGDTVSVSLHSTYWQLAPPAGNVLRPRGPATTATGGPGCPAVPGSGCGTLTQRFEVTADGTATIAAHRDSCGEAMRCAAGRGDWSVKVTASG